ncbi:MAG: hypothetical protein JOZ11_17085, partial [Alphaproteobacteria bacterium]|nr:hypothetical protein [Alphaproteobacteria bacterium]
MSSFPHFAIDREVGRREAVPLRQDFGDPAAMADLPIGFLAQQAARRGFGDFRGLQ